MRDNNLGFFDYIDTLSKQNKSKFLLDKIDKSHFILLDKQAEISLKQLEEIESSDEISFDEFLKNYFKK